MLLLLDDAALQKRKQGNLFYKYLFLFFLPGPSFERREKSFATSFSSVMYAAAHRVIIYRKRRYRERESERKVVRSSVLSLFGESTPVLRRV